MVILPPQLRFWVRGRPTSHPSWPMARVISYPSVLEVLLPQFRLRWWVRGGPLTTPTQVAGAKASYFASQLAFWQEVFLTHRCSRSSYFSSDCWWVWGGRPTTPTQVLGARSSVSYLSTQTRWLVFVLHIPGLLLFEFARSLVFLGVGDGGGKAVGGGGRFPRCCSPGLRTWGSPVPIWVFLPSGGPGCSYSRSPVPSWVFLPSGLRGGLIPLIPTTLVPCPHYTAHRGEVRGKNSSPPHPLTWKLGGVGGCGWGPGPAAGCGYLPRYLGAVTTRCRSGSLRAAPPELPFSP